jgi:hypothetical protein
VIGEIDEYPTREEINVEVEEAEWQENIQISY